MYLIKGSEEAIKNRFYLPVKAPESEVVDGLDACVSVTWFCVVCCGERILKPEWSGINIFLENCEVRVDMLLLLNQEGRNVHKNLSLI